MVPKVGLWFGKITSHQISWPMWIRGKSQMKPGPLQQSRVLDSFERDSVRWYNKMQYVLCLSNMFFLLEFFASLVFPK